MTLFILIVANISVVKPEKGEKLEMILIQVSYLSKSDLFLERLKRNVPRKGF